MSSSNSTNGSVKWFNKNAGYGFITATDGERKDEDVFVHHSALNVSKEQFRYLVEGEHVSFTWAASGKDEDHARWQADNVTGANGGKLMCETRNDARAQQESSGDDSRSSRGKGRGRGRGSHSRPRFQTSGPCVTDDKGNTYRLVPSNSASAQPM